MKQLSHSSVEADCIVPHAPVYDPQIDDLIQQKRPREKIGRLNILHRPEAAQSWSCTSPLKSHIPKRYWRSHYHCIPFMPLLSLCPSDYIANNLPTHSQKNIKPKPTQEDAPSPSLRTSQNLKRGLHLKKHKYDILYTPKSFSTCLPSHQQ